MDLFISLMIDTCLAMSILNFPVEKVSSCQPNRKPEEFQHQLLKSSD